MTPDMNILHKLHGFPDTDLAKELRKKVNDRVRGGLDLLASKIHIILAPAAASKAPKIK
jgi:hypothetical protein